MLCFDSLDQLCTLGITLGAAKQTSKLFADFLDDIWKCCTIAIIYAPQIFSLVPIDELHESDKSCFSEEI